MGDKEAERKIIVLGNGHASLLLHFFPILSARV